VVSHDKRNNALNNLKADRNNVSFLVKRHLPQYPVLVFSRRRNVQHISLSRFLRRNRRTEGGPMIAILYRPQQRLAPDSSAGFEDNSEYIFICNGFVIRICSRKSPIRWRPQKIIANFGP